MDVDLSTDLHALLPLLAPLLSGHSEVAIGIAPGARIAGDRAAPSASSSHAAYNRILHVALRARFSDAQCGFKAVRADVLPELLAAVRDQSWFFDTELLIAGAASRDARSTRCRSTGSTTPTRASTSCPTALADLRGVARLAMATPVARFAAIGVVSTLAYALLFLLLAGALGSAAASAVALALTAVGNTAANRRLTFGIRGREGLFRQQLAGLLVFLLALALTNGALGVLHDLDRHPPRLLEAGGAGARHPGRDGHALRRALVAGCSAAVPGAVAATRSCPSTRKETEMSTTTFPRPIGRFGRPGSGPAAVGSGRWCAGGPRTRRGRASALIGLLAATAVAYLWNLTASGDANSFYAAAVQAGTKSWKAFFFGSLDSSNFITVDKPPGVAVGDGAVRADLRLLEREHARPAGARGRARRRPADGVREALVRHRRRACSRARCSR